MLDKLDVLDERCFNISLKITVRKYFIYDIKLDNRCNYSEFSFNMIRFDQEFIKKIKEEFKYSCTKLEISFECC